MAFIWMAGQPTFGDIEESMNHWQKDKAVLGKDHQDPSYFDIEREICELYDRKLEVSQMKVSSAYEFEFVKCARMNAIDAQIANLRRQQEMLNETRTA
jgi:hypothetical protein